MTNLTHEQVVEHGAIKRSSDRSFGLTVGGILAAIGAARWWWFDATGWSTTALAVGGGALMLAGFVAPSALAPLNRAWTRLGELMARVVNPIILFLMFAVVFVPTAILLRLKGRDALGLRRDRGQSSYWVVRTPPAPDPATMIHQF